MRSTLFICSANQCRSPMAEALFIQYIKEKGYDLKKWIVSSAGCWVIPGMPATLNAKMVVEEKNAHLYFPSSKAISEKMVKDYNVLLCMGNNHSQFIKRNFPKSSNNIFLLSEMIGEKFEIEDPVGKTLKDYRKTANLLSNILKSGFSKISDLSKA